MASLRNKRLSDQGGEQICRERGLFRARLRSLPSYDNADGPWDMNLDELPIKGRRTRALFDQTMREARTTEPRSGPKVPRHRREPMFGSRLRGAADEYDLGSRTQ
ncbi:unnamed protein product [Trichogramma brassicae]|uniref:Uncharacterized protein n=1 Tax=Trichogramma brassicae TaxID=86971 RepID=A0A6H5J492_9HYME|nr:unnamed protein product [Trichogramma brassicae]